ncbi:MAG: V-type ATP synthase subunit D [Thermodesulfovibrionales bacterium]|nr:V-type ATP synthase subunit D [Thermodesulfovibrionales bacterium]
MIHPTRTNLLLLKERLSSVVNSIGILKGRRQVLIREFLNATIPFLRTRDGIRKLYGRALEELALSLGHEGKKSIESITAISGRDIGVEITEKSIWGLRYRDVNVHDSPVRKPDERGYDFLSATQHLDEGIYLFEKIVESMLNLAEFESKLKRLGKEILKTTRRIRVIEERIMPDLKNQIRTISQYIGERDREAYYRLKMVKGRQVTLRMLKH